jgi:hypothetical protein
MPRQRNTIKERLKEFHFKCTNPDSDEVQATVRKALKDRHCLLIKQAAVICEERLFYDLEAGLLKAYQRFLKKPIKTDPNCIAKGAIARTLVALDCQDADFFIAGLSYQQIEPVWGGTEDTAIDLRVSCAMGLVNTSYPRALIEIIPLLHDSNPHVRIGAVRAIAVTQPLAAEAVLRSKALAEDSEPDVTAETLSALLAVAPDESQEFVASFFEAYRDPILRQTIALAIGASKVDVAVDILHSCWTNTPLKTERDNYLLLGAILHRSEKALAWLLDVVLKGNRASAQFIVTELAIYRTERRLRESLEASLLERGDDDLIALFSEIWN